jgi:hypothetical protein
MEVAGSKSNLEEENGTNWNKREVKGSEGKLRG